MDIPLTITNNIGLLKFVNKWVESKTPLVDCRPADDFFSAHLPRSTNIPYKDIAQRSGELPPRGTTLSLLYPDLLTYGTVHKYLADTDYSIATAAVIEHETWTTFDTKEIVQNSADSAIIWEPSPVLKGEIDRIEQMRIENGLPATGEAVDLACGSGRDCIYLARRNWKSHGYDYLQASLDRAHALAERYNAIITTTCEDLEKEDGLLTLPKADLVNVSRYLHRPILPQIAEMVNPGGFIIYHQFMVGCTKPRRERFLLAEGELATFFTSKGFEIIEDKVFTISDGRPCSWFLARKLL